jgi:resuscitation-promoting factor RpfB
MLRMILAVLSSGLIILAGTALAAVSARIQVDGTVLVVSDPPATVRETLTRSRIALGPEDEVLPSPDAPVPADGLIRVRRVSYVERTEEQALPYRTVVRPASGKGAPFHPTVVQQGKSGRTRVSYRLRMVDGAEADRVVLREQVVREPVHQLVLSRRPAVLGSRGAYAGQRTMEVVATAYDPGAGSCGKYADGRTCNGKRAGYGVIAVDPTLIPLGTKLFVPGYGYGIAADVGGAIKGYKIDLGYNSRAGALAWGRRTVTLRVVE